MGFEYLTLYNQPEERIIIWINLDNNELHGYSLEMLSGGKGNFESINVHIIKYLQYLYSV